MTGRSAQRGQVSVALVGLACLLAIAAAGLVTLGRVRAVQAHAGAVADDAALAGARVLHQRYDDLFPRRDPTTGRTDPPRLTAAGLERLAAEAVRGDARARGATLVSLRFASPGRDVAARSLEVAVRVADELPGWLGASRRRRLATANARAGVALARPAAVPDAPRPVDLSGFGTTARAVVAAAHAQLGWPYVWGGESRAEGGFDCSGLVAYALAAAGHGVGRPTADGLQRLAAAVPIDRSALVPGDLLFVGEPAHHVGLYGGRGLVIEAPHRGAVVHLEPLADGGWTGAGRLPQLAAAAGTDGPAGPDAAPEVPDWAPEALRAWIGEAARREGLPPTLLAAQLEAESGFDAAATSSAGAQGIAQFMPATWSGEWNPYRAHTPFEPRWAVLAQARYLGRLLDRAEGDVPRALAAYNAGWSGTVHEWPDETLAYVTRILRRFGGPQAIAPLPPDGREQTARPPAVRLLPLAGAPVGSEGRAQAGRSTRRTA